MSSVELPNMLATSEKEERKLVECQKAKKIVRIEKKTSNKDIQEVIVPPGSLNEIDDRPRKEED